MLDWMNQEIAPVSNTAAKKKTKSKKRNKESEKVMDEWRHSRGATGNIDSLGHDYYDDPNKNMYDHSNNGDEMSEEISYLIDNNSDERNNDDNESKCDTYLDDDAAGKSSANSLSPMPTLKMKQRLNKKKKKKLQKKKMLPSVAETRRRRRSKSRDYSHEKEDESSMQNDSDESSASSSYSYDEQCYGNDDEYESFFAYLDKQNQGDTAEASSKKKKKDTKKKKEEKERKGEQKKVVKRSKDKSRSISPPPSPSPPPPPASASELLGLVSPSVVEMKKGSTEFKAEIRTRALQSELQTFTKTTTRGLRKSRRASKEKNIHKNLGYGDAAPTRGDSDVANAALRAIRRSSLGMLPNSMSTDSTSQLGTTTSRIDQRLEARPARVRGSGHISYRRSSLNMRIARSEMALESEAFKSSISSFGLDSSSEHESIRSNSRSSRDMSSKSFGLDPSDHSSSSYVPFSQRKPSFSSVDISDHSSSRRRGSSDSSWSSADFRNNDFSSKGLLSELKQDTLTEFSQLTKNRSHRSSSTIKKISTDSEDRKTAEKKKQDNKKLSSKN
jgi:hypothetical protein